MNNDQFDQIQMHLFKIEQEENRKRLLARDAITSKLRNLISNFSGEPSVQRMKQTDPEQQFEDHSISVPLNLAEKTYENPFSSVDWHALNLTLVTGNQWKTLNFSSDTDNVISARGVWNDLDTLIGQIVGQVNKWRTSNDNSPGLLKFRLDHLFNMTSGSESRYHKLEAGPTTIESIELTDFGESKGNYYKVTLPNVELDIKTITSNEKNGQFVFLDVVKIKTEGETIIRYYEGNEETTLDQHILQSAFEGFEYDPYIIDLCK